jgi:hypothetical protein
LRNPGKREIMSHNVSITNDEIMSALRKIIKDSSNKEDFVLLLNDLLADSHMGSTYFIKLMLGSSLPKIPKVGDQGYILVDSLGYGHDKEKYKNSEFCQQGYIPCTVSRINSIASYSPIYVTIPDIGQSEKEVGISIDKFHEGDSIDIYDDLPI